MKVLGIPVVENPELDKLQQQPLILSGDLAASLLAMMRAVDPQELERQRKEREV